MYNIQGYSDEEMQERAKNFVGKTVHTTYGAQGRVTAARVEKDHIKLYVLAANGLTFQTTNELATIVTLGDYSQPDINPGNRGELIEDEE